ncbi:MAG: hypothetical protein P9L94_12560 [Candidatus Hinthialibacter antarcticus]|nr:hypothetical protein [Candidatus Hinthialibacter antarcticus]
MPYKTIEKTEFGDWQTPLPLAKEICALITQKVQPRSVFEPNCGKGAFLHAAMESCTEAVEFVGLEINKKYVDEVRSIESGMLTVIHDDFFSCSLENIIQKLPEPLLVIGNPPWVTNSELTRIRSENLPNKTNFNGVSGIDAITGKSNFDISEWMLIQEVEALQGKDALLAMLCKTAVARKVILFMLKKAFDFSEVEIRKIDAQKFFRVAVDACLFVVRFLPKQQCQHSDCRIYLSLKSNIPSDVLGMRNGRLVTDVETVDRFQDVLALNATDFTWRSGVKHDCSKVMELFVQSDGRLKNGFKDYVDIEDALLYPMLKSSDLANGRTREIHRRMLITQQSVGSDTKSIQYLYPKMWHYLNEHAEKLNNRRSSIYKNRPPFSIFGVGDYSFKPWKVAISGLYKKLQFSIIGPYEGKPVVVDDTCYFLSCESEEEANVIGSIFASKVVQDILIAHIFWDSKRPITRDILSIIDIPAAARRIGCFEALVKVCRSLSHHKQSDLFAMRF